MEKILTVVVPVYKVERYINKCLDSCLLYDEKGEIDYDKMNQLEVIIVNDGTPDHSAELSREYTFRYPSTFRQIDKENGGHGSAWNVGLKEAKGKYLRFLDSDDWFTNLGKLMDILYRTDSDIVFNDYVKVNESSGEEEYKNIISATGQILPISMKMLYNQTEGPFTLNFWHTTYKTEILKPQWPLFAEHVMYDDYILCEAPLLFGRNYIYLNFPVYHYLVGRSGQSMDINVIKRNVSSYVKCYERQVEWINDAFKHDLPDELKVCIKDSVTHFACIVFGKLIYLPYHEAKRKMPVYYRDGYVNSNAKHSKMASRYRKLPFFIFYFLERIRFMIKKNH